MDQNLDKYIYKKKKEFKVIILCLIVYFKTLYIGVSNYGEPMRPPK
jgi:hypothetical protein